MPGSISFDFSNQCVAAVIVSVPEVRFNFELSGAKEKVQAVAGEISWELQGK